MIFQNQQANILRVNGALADNFANRPASQGTYYIFYSLDTQEIFYDDVTGWILLGSGSAPPPPPSVNIYNSNGTLTGNRQVNCNNNFLQFLDASSYKILTGGSNAINGIEINFNSVYSLLNNVNNGIYLERGLYIFGGFNDFGTHIRITDFNFSQKFEILGPNLTALSADFTNNEFTYGYGKNNPFDYNNITITKNETKLIQKDILGYVQYLTLDLTNTEIYTFGKGNISGFKFNFANRLYQFGQLNGSNITRLIIDDTNRFIKTSQGGGQDTGIRLDFLQRQFDFGQITGGNFTYLSIDDVNNTIQTIHSAANKGLYLDFTNRLYEFGNGAYNNKTRLSISDTTQSIQLQSNFQIGLSLDFVANQYEFGNSTAPNATLFKILDSAVYPLQISGTNVLSGTSGGSSGQHLKVKINGIDYKIKLDNP